jgi:hypothetical protein
MARKGSRKGSRKVSRKGSKKGSRKGSRRSMKREEGAGTEERGNVKYLHKLSTTEVKDGAAVVHEELVVHGENDKLSFKYYHKDDKSKIKVVGRQNDDGTFSLRMLDGDKTDEKTVSKDELLKMLAKDKHLGFALTYIKSQKGGKKTSRKSSKKASKKRSKKSSRK